MVVMCVHSYTRRDSHKYMCSALHATAGGDVWNFVLCFEAAKYYSAFNIDEEEASKAWHKRSHSLN